MKHKTVKDRASHKVSSMKKTAGYSNYTEEFLITNFNQVQFYSVASLSKFLYSSQIYIANACETDEWKMRNNGENASINVGFKYCHSTFNREVVDSIMKELERVAGLAASMKLELQELIELQELPVE
jgi:hypothetical protein